VSYDIVPQLAEGHAGPAGSTSGFTVAAADTGHLPVNIRMVARTSLAVKSILVFLLFSHCGIVAGELVYVLNGTPPIPGAVQVQQGQGSAASRHGWFWGSGAGC
jgi:hypothetical protein